MKLIKTLILAVTGLALLSATSQAQLSLNFSSSPGGAPNGGASLQFNGAADSFQFNAASTPSTIPNPPGPPIVINYYLGSQWSVTSESGGTGSALSLLGSINNGPFNYAPVVISGNEQSAAVIGPLGGLIINDNAGVSPINYLTGNVNWIQVSTYNYGGSIGINGAFTINVSGLSYGGSNPDLLALASTGNGGIDLTFQFSPGMTLSQLSTGSTPFLTSFSGSISPVPEPSTMILTSIGGLGVLLLRRRK